MTKAAQMRVSALLKDRWGANVAITHQRDGGLVALIHYGEEDGGGMSVIEVVDENSPTLRYVGCIDVR